MGPPFTAEAVRALYDKPLLALLDESRAVHRANHADDEVQLCTLLSVKTGGCAEDCALLPAVEQVRHERRAGADARRRAGDRQRAAR